MTKASKKLCCPIRKVCIVRPTVSTSHYPDYFFSLLDDCSFLIYHRHWITNESPQNIFDPESPQNIVDPFHLLFSKRYRLTASDRISSLIPIQIPSRIGPVSRIHNPLVFVFLLAKISFLFVIELLKYHTVPSIF